MSEGERGRAPARRKCAGHRRRNCVPPIVGEACAQLDDGASPDEVVEILGALGVDKNSARTLVGMAARVLLLNEPVLI